MIRHASRLITIILVLGRYRLDDLVAKVGPLKWARLVRLIPGGRRGVRHDSLGHRLRRALEELGPIYVKFGQILSTRRDLLPPDIADALSLLQDDVAPFDSQQAKAIVAAELKQPLEACFEHFDETPMASASIAQVHGATLKDGQSVVVKIVRPGIETQIKSDLMLLYQLARLVRRYHPEGDRIRPDEVVAEFERVITNELDMQAEAANCTMIRRNFEHSQELYIPRIHWPLTANRILVMERVSGIPVRDIERLKALGVDLEKLARLGIRLFYRQVFRDNLFHADMHPGNILVDATDPKNPSFIALDFGIVASLTQKDLYYIGENFLAIFNREYRRVAELHVEAGWVPSDTRVDELEAAARTVCEPNFTRPLEEVSFAELVVELFTVARRFKLTIQPQLIMLQKTLLNIEGMGRELHPKLNIWEVAKPELEAAYRERYGMEKTLETITKQIPGWLARSPDLPNLLFDAIRLTASGQVRTRIETEDLANLVQQVTQHNTRLPSAILAAGSLIGGAILVGYQTPPLYEGYSVAGLVALAIGLWTGWRSFKGN
jgi:ubiquinone biosynthesis protein